MTMSRPQRDPARLFAPPAVQRMDRADGTTILRCANPLDPYDRCVGDWLIEWAGKAPERPFLLDRGDDGRWRGVTYSQALQSVRRIASWLLREGASAERPVAVLSDNSVEHGLLALAAMHVGVPVMPISPAYSLVSKDFAKLRAVFTLAAPAVIYVADAARFAPALAAVRKLHDGIVVAGTGASAATGTRSFSELLASTIDAATERAFAAVRPDTLAKVLFTSGSTGSPKGVATTQRMLCSNQQANAQVWPFLREHSPVLVDWLPWSHTFGGSFCFNMVLRHGGTLHIDGGKPAPGAFETTIRNLSEIAPTLYFNVPRGYDLLVTALRADARLREMFFSRLQLIFYAAAALPQHLWDALGELAQQTVGERIVLTTAWGSTETGPLAASCHYDSDDAGIIGVPVPGCELKLAPCGEKMEVRVRGANLTPGYWQRPELTASCFDEEGFYKIGDAVRLVDAARPERGLRFDGRVAEDFKLSTGTWVNAGALRVQGLAALAPVAQDIVVAGRDRDAIAFLIFPNWAACRQLCGELGAEQSPDGLLKHPILREHIRAGLRELARRGTGTSTFAARALLVAEPPSIDAGEITDKGYINQAAVLARRRDLVEMLYCPDGHPDVIAFDGSATS